MEGFDDTSIVKLLCPKSRQLLFTILPELLVIEILPKGHLVVHSKLLEDKSLLHISLQRHGRSQFLGSIDAPVQASLKDVRHLIESSFDPVSAV